MPQTHIENLIDREYFGMKLGLGKIQHFLAGLGHPEQEYPSFHIAGTNGKGSTALILTRLLEAHGYRAGLFSSPHLESVTERIQINGQAITERRLDELARTVEQRDAVSGAERLSFFECMSAIAFQYFSEEDIDVAVVEVGMGGRLDATNVLKPVVTLLTPISYDHRQHLGKSLTEIAREKAGIIKEYVPIVCAPQKREVRAVFQEVAQAKGAPLEWVAGPERFYHDGSFDFGPFKHLWLPTLGNAFVRNACMAITAARHFTRLETNAVMRGLNQVYLPGRLEIAGRKPLIILDGAHNVQALTHLRETVQGLFPGLKRHCLFAAMGDKEVGAMLKTLVPLKLDWHFTTLQAKRALSVAALQEQAKRLGLKAKFHTTCGEALRTLLRILGEEDLLIVTGSFYLVGEARKWLH